MCLSKARELSRGARFATRYFRLVGQQVARSNCVLLARLAACPKDAKLQGPLETLLGIQGLIIFGLVDGKGGQTLVSLSKTWLSGPKMLRLKFNLWPS